MHNDLVEILMATYNGEKYLESQIHSILGQSHQNIRLLICDDHSKDGTKDLIEKLSKAHPDKIRVMTSQKNLGAIGNFSFLLEFATADYVMFSDQDDLWMKEKIAKTLAKMKQLEEVHGKDLPLLVHTDLTVVNQEGAVLGDSFWKYANLKPFSFHTTNRFLIQNVVTGCTMMMNQQLCKKSFPVPKESMMHDWWIALVAATFGKIGIVNEPLILYRQHGSNTLGAKKFEVLKFLKEGFKRYWKGDPSIQNQTNKRLAQAEIFFKRYRDRLNQKQKRTVSDYLALQNYSPFKKRFVVLKQGFYRSGFLRNFFLFILGPKP